MLRLQSAFPPEGEGVSGNIPKGNVFSKIRDPEIITCLEWRMKLDRVQQQQRAGCQHENHRKSSAIKEPAPSRASYWKQSHDQQQWRERKAIEFECLAKGRGELPTNKVSTDVPP